MLLQFLNSQTVAIITPSKIRDLDGSEYNEEVLHHLKPDMIIGLNIQTDWDNFNIYDIVYQGPLEWISEKTILLKNHLGSISYQLNETYVKYSSILDTMSGLYISELENINKFSTIRKIHLNYLESFVVRLERDIKVICNIISTIDEIYYKNFFGMTNDNEYISIKPSNELNNFITLQKNIAEIIDIEIFEKSDFTEMFSCELFSYVHPWNHICFAKILSIDEDKIEAMITDPYNTNQIIYNIVKLNDKIYLDKSKISFIPVSLNGDLYDFSQYIVKDLNADAIKGNSDIQLSLNDYAYIIFKYGEFDKLELCLCQVCKADEELDMYECYIKETLYNKTDSPLLNTIQTFSIEDVQEKVIL